ncbi:hypothetical protein GCM10023264_18640 [Sphingomonas daechungensis]|uniref:DUF4403 family protein n=1 Tax=Sphingomonas daechungensis TaxID=1176646 RepID=UPI0031EC926C
MIARCGVLALLACALASCNRTIEIQAPPKVETKAELPKLISTLEAPIVVPMADVQAALNRAAPTVLWNINQYEDACVPAQRAFKGGKVLGVKIFGRKGLKVTPNLGCQIVGRAVRGPIRLSGQGQILQMTMPVSAVVSVRDVGGIIRQETATGAVNVTASVRLGMRSDWTPTAKLDITYNWTNPPGIDLLGRRITFIKQADSRLTGVVAGLEKSLPAELQKLNVRPQVAQIWGGGFTTILLNRENPPAWMRVSPQKLGVVGYNANKTNITLTIAAQLLTETFVGERPTDPVPTPLPPAANGLKEVGIVFNTPVIADYGEIEPVILRALQKRAAKGINIRNVGAVDATFQKVTVYATENGRVAVGIDLAAQLVGKPRTRTSAVVWLTGTLFNEPNSAVLSVHDLAIAGDTSNAAVNLAIRLFTDPTMIGTVQAALTEDFAKDYDHVIAAARKAIQERRQGDVVVSAQIDKVESGRIEATGQGLFLPVRATGSGTIKYQPMR